MKPGGGGEPSGALAAGHQRQVGQLRGVQGGLHKSAVGNFGSGWTWLVKKATARSTSSTRAPPARR
jgi:Fe-Mn family superoxide dismutase